MGITANKLDLSILPDEAKREAIDFFEFLKSKYKKTETEKMRGKERLLKIFNESKGVLPEGYKFDREEAHER